MAFILGFVLSSSMDSATLVVILDLESSGGCSVQMIDFVDQFKVAESY